MNKKTAILTGGAVLVASLFTNFMIVSESGTEDLILANVEALASATEDSGDITIRCLEVGTICLGEDKNGNFGKYPGLAIKRSEEN